MDLTLKRNFQINVNILSTGGFGQPDVSPCVVLTMCVRVSLGQYVEYVFSSELSISSVQVLDKLNLI